VRNDQVLERNILVRSELCPVRHYTVFLYFVCEAIGTAATPGLLCQPRVRVKMIVEKQMECSLAGETEVLGENLPQRHFCPSQNPTWPDPGLNPSHPSGKPATNCLSYIYIYIFFVCDAICIAVIPGLLCQPRVIVKMIVKKEMECRLAVENEVLGENLSQRHFCPLEIPTWPDRRGGKPATNRLSYGAAFIRV
jgi:hypothetical protein